MLTRRRNPHTIVLAYAACQVAGWVWNIGVGGAHISGGFTLVSVFIELLVLWGLWLFERWLWLMILVLGSIAEVLIIARVVQDQSATLAVGGVFVALQLALLLHPSLRYAMRKR